MTQYQQDIWGGLNEVKIKKNMTKLPPHPTSSGENILYAVQASRLIKGVRAVCEKCSGDKPNLSKFLVVALFSRGESCRYHMCARHKEQFLKTFSPFSNTGTLT